MQDFLQLLSDLLADGGVHVSPEAIGLILTIVAAIVVVRLVIAIVRTVISAVHAVASFTRNQVKNKFWRDSGKLATLISFLLLVIAYGFYGQDQPRQLDEALLELGRAQVLDVLPIAILTQVVLLCGFWLIYGYIFRVPGKTLADPFKMMLTSVVWVAMLSIGSTGTLLITGDDPEAALLMLGTSMMVGVLFIVLIAPRMVASAKKQAEEARAGVRPRMRAIHVIFLLAAVTLLFAMTGSVFAAVYTAISDQPTVIGMIGFVTIVVAVIMLIACYRFRAYIDQAEVPPATGYFIDLSLAISALAIALTSQPGAEVSLGGVPPWLIAVVPAFLVAAAVFGFNLLRLRTATPRWELCLAVAIIAGLLAGPAKQLLVPVLTPVADLLPVPHVMGI